MKSLSISFLIILLFSAICLPQNLWKQSNKEKVSSLNLTPVIYIPGIMGSPLYDDINNNNKLVVDEKAWFGRRLPGIWLDGNGIDPAGNYNIKISPIRNDTLNTLRDELTTVPMDLFIGFFDNLEANGYILDNYDNNHNEGENLYCFTYDWRKDNGTNAQLLSHFIDSVITWTGVDSVNLVGHSMGGIVSKTCINLFDNSRIDKMVFIGTPHLGAPEMQTVMLNGKLFEWLNFIIANHLVISLARNLPSGYQLIPSSSYLNLEFKNDVSTDVDIYSECFQLPDRSFADYSEMIEYLRNYKSSFGEDLNDALLDSSELYKESIDTVDFSEVEVFNIVGYNQWTIGKNSVIIGPPPINWISIVDERNLNGDYTVPLRSAELINNKVFEHTYYIPDVIHSGLPSSQQTQEILLGVFSNPPITNFPQFAEPPHSYRGIVLSTEENDLEIPYSFYLPQNFPNPFNPTTTIVFTIPPRQNPLLGGDYRGGLTTLTVYDILGNEIATLINEEKPTGTYTVHWNAAGLPSGVYFYQLQTESFISTKKMILLR